MSSRLSREIQAYQLRNQKISPHSSMRLASFDMKVTPREQHYNTEYEYRFEARFGTKTYVPKEGVQYALDTIRQAVIDEIYGDIRRLLIELHFEILDSSNNINLYGSNIIQLMDKLMKETEA